MLPNEQAHGTPGASLTMRSCEVRAAVVPAPS